MKTKENDYICGTCKYYDRDDCYCMARGEREVYELDTCDGWTDPDEVEPTEDEKRANAGDIECHRRIVED